MAGGSSYKTTGAREAFEGLRNRILAPIRGAKVAAVVGAIGTSPKEIPRLKGGDKNKIVRALKEPRSAAQNVIILRTQATKGRRVGYVSHAETMEGLQVWARAAEEQMRSGGNALMEGAFRVAEYLITVFQRHIEKGQGEGGMKPLKDKYREFKKRIFGGELPILVATGQLYESFKPGARLLK